MTYEELARLAADSGFSHWASLSLDTVELLPAVREMCASGNCAQYGKRWSCPPGCGTLEDCATRVRQYAGGILVQTVGDIEDSFDIEAMGEIQEQHKKHFREMHAALRRSGVSTLALGAGCCTICKTCTYPDAPCRFPDVMVSSMEAYGMLVLEVCKANGLTYYYGPDKMAYTGCFLL